MSGPAPVPSFPDFLRSAAPGRSLRYWRGNLAVDAQNLIEARRLRAAVAEAEEMGRVHLVQRRHGVEDYEYIAIKRAAA